jgi:hypothetical protein
MFLQVDLFSFSQTKVNRQRHLHNCGSFPGIKQPGCEVNHSPPPSAKDKNQCSYSSTSPVCLHEVGKENVYLFISEASTCVFKLIIHKLGEEGGGIRRQGSCAYMYTHTYLMKYMWLNDVNEYGNQYRQ